MVEKLSHEQLKTELDSDSNVKLVNVLSNQSFEEKHIPNSQNIPLDKIPEKAPQLLNKDDKIVVYCANFDCNASPKAAKKLEEMGYQNVYDYEGGIEDWQKAGYPVKGNNK